MVLLLPWRKIPILSLRVLISIAPSHSRRYGLAMLRARLVFVAALVLVLTGLVFWPGRGTRRLELHFLRAAVTGDTVDLVFRLNNLPSRYDGSTPLKVGAAGGTKLAAVPNCAMRHQSRGRFPSRPYDAYLPSEAFAAGSVSACCAGIQGAVWAEQLFDSGKAPPCSTDVLGFFEPIQY